MRKTILSTSVMLALVAAGVGAYFEYFDTRPVPKVSTAAITSGDVIEVVKATGTLTPMRSVDVGTQVSGTVTKLYVDFNSIVKKGQLLAELDPAVYRDALDSARAAVDQAQIALDQQRQVMEIDRRNLERTQVLFAGSVAMQQDVDTATVAVKQDEAMVVEDQASIVAAQAGVEQAELNLSYCTIYSPIDGVVISRDVDEGQTVAARMSTPSLYLLGTDLQTLQLIGDVDESNTGRLRPGQHVTFTVEAYPTTTFNGTVSEVRLNATTTNNVVTYQAVIKTPNPDLRLLPGMTATLSIETSRVAQVVRVPNSALRFQPTADMFTAFGQPVPPSIKLATAHVTPSASTSILAWRIQPVSSDSVAKKAVAKAAGKPDTTIDKFFEPLPATKRPAEVWSMNNGHLVAARVELGITDGTWTQMLSGDVQPGDEIVSSILVPAAAKTARR